MKLIALTTLSAAAVLTAQMALAVGSDDSAPPKPTETTMDCTDGQVWDEAKQVCADPKESRLDDDIRYGAARELAYDGQYENALKVLAAADNPQDPRILNYKGFTTRKLGDIDGAMKFYRAALALDPDYILARSYMGQALVEMGDLVGARAQLLEIRDRNGRDTWAYAALEKSLLGEITGY
jgi:Flp pilus assembly protein TadD